MRSNRDAFRVPAFEMAVLLEIAILIVQFILQGFGVFKIGSVEALDEPVVEVGDRANRRKQIHSVLFVVLWCFFELGVCSEVVLNPKLCTRLLQKRIDGHP